MIQGAKQGIVIGRIMVLSIKLRKGQLKSSAMLDCKDCMGLKVKEICLNKHTKKDIPKRSGSGSH